MLLISLFVVDNLYDNFINFLKHLELKNAKIISKKFFGGSRKILFIAQLNSHEYLDEAIVELKEKISDIATKLGVTIEHDIYSISTSEPIDPRKTALARFYCDLILRGLRYDTRVTLLRELKLTDLELIFLIFVYYLERIAIDQIIELINWLYGYSTEKLILVAHSLEDNGLIVRNEHIVSLSILGASKVNKFFKHIVQCVCVSEREFGPKLCISEDIGINVVLGNGDVVTIKNLVDLEELLNTSVSDEVWCCVVGLYNERTINSLHLKVIVDHLSRILFINDSNKHDG